MKKQYEGLLGAHMSIAGGIDKAFFRGQSIGCTTIQIFTHSNRQWKMKDLSQETIERAKQAQQETGIRSPLVHASYLINLGSLSPDTVSKSIDLLEHELINCDSLGFAYLVLHPGSGSKNSDECIAQIASNINVVLKRSSTRATILLENMAGQGTSVGSTFEQLADIKKSIVHRERIGFCLDLCHAWAAGYDFSTPKTYVTMWDNFDKILGIKNLKAIHMNDSLKKLGARVDRHADIGKGTIPLEAFSLLMNDKRFLEVSKVLETPTDTLDGYAHNLEILKSLV